MSDENQQPENPEPLAKSPEEARKRAFDLIIQNWPGIINVFTANAIAGSVPHAKFLQDWAEIGTPTPKKEAKDEKSAPNRNAEFSLAQLILDTLAAHDRGELKQM